MCVYNCVNIIMCVYNYVNIIMCVYNYVNIIMCIYIYYIQIYPSQMICLRFRFPPNIQFLAALFMGKTQKHIGSTINQKPLGNHPK